MRHQQERSGGVTIPGPRQELTDGQIAVLSLLSKGLTTEQIGKRLFLAHGTVKSRLKVSYARLGARSAAHAVALLHARGVLPLPDPPRQERRGL